MNMNYCKFENTYKAMVQVNEDDCASSALEGEYKARLVKQCIYFLESIGYSVECEECEECEE